MTRTENGTPFDFDELNRQFYLEKGPGDFLFMRLLALCVIGGEYEKFKSILADEVKFANLTLVLPTSDDGGEDADMTTLDPNQDESDEADQQYFLRIETHHLKHLTIETLLRLFLGHRDLPPCPWFEISKAFDFRKFKERVRVEIVQADPESLQSDIAFTVLGQVEEMTTIPDEVRQSSANLTSLLQMFAEEWLNEAKSYNATKHGLTAIPDSTEAYWGTDTELITLGSGDSLTHLSTQGWEGDTREWSLTTRWIREEQAIGMIAVAVQMIKALWTVARVRYGMSEGEKLPGLPPPSMTPKSLMDAPHSPGIKLHMARFTERRNPPP